MGDLQASNPHKWLPKGTTYTPGSFKMPNDVQQIYGGTIAKGLIERLNPRTQTQV